MTRQSLTSALGIVAALTLAGCEVGPNFHRPKMAVPSHWADPTTPSTGHKTPAAATAGNGIRSVVSRGPAHLAKWWTGFHDPVLNSLINRALAQNLSLKQAQEQIVNAREIRDASAATLGPFVSGTAAYTHSRGSRNTGSGGGGFGPSESDLYQAGFDATWELDIFGQVRRGVQAANADLKAAVDSRRGLMVTLLGEVGNDYMALRGVQQQIAITRYNLASQLKTVKLLKAQIGGGIATQLALTSAEAQAQTTGSQIPELQIQERTDIYAISLLISQTPESLVKELSAAEPVPPPPPVVPIGLPGELLLRRPDVRQAEQQYAAATANVGVAEGNLFPQFTINGNLGYAASNAAKWFDASSLAYGIGPSVSWSLLNWGQVNASINEQKALRIAALLNYHQAVLQALSDADSALAAYTREQVHEHDLAVAAAENERAVRLSLQLYKSGLTDYLNVLQAQQSLFASQESLVLSRTAVSADLVALYKALGGGWKPGSYAAAMRRK